MAELAALARRLGKGKNTIIAEAIRDYLLKMRSTDLAEEARRQSIAASRVMTEDEMFWQAQFDERGWK
jgi:predicted DNA-binding protein